MAARICSVTYLLCRQQLKGAQAIFQRKGREGPLSLVPDPPSSSGESSPPEHSTDVLRDASLSEHPHYKTSVLGDESLADAPAYNPDILDDSEVSMEELDKYDVEYDERDLLQYRTSTLNDLLELENLPIMHVRCSYNNTYITICDKNGQVKAWRSCGSEGYKNSRKGTSIAAQATAQAAAHKAHELGFHRVRVKLKGPGSGRQYSLKGFQLGGLDIASIQDVTPVPHNGCKPKKKRRI